MLPFWDSLQKTYNWLLSPFRKLLLIMGSNNTTVYSDGAVQFTAADKAGLNIPSNSTLQTGAIDWEMGYWVNMTTKTATMTIAAKSATGVGGSEYSLYYSVSSDRFKFVTANATTANILAANTFGSPSINTWYFIRAWRTNADSKIHISVNGVEDNQVETVTPTVTATALWIGNDANNAFPFDGSIDSGYFTKTITSTSDVPLLYNAGSGRMYDGNNGLAENGLSTFKSNLISWWGFNEENGTRYDSKGTNHLAQTFTNIVNPTTLNGGFETRGTNGGLSTNVSTATVARASNVVTIVTAAAHGLASTNVVTITGLTDTTLNASGVAVTVTDATTFTYTKAGSDVSVGADTGGRVATDVFANWTETASGSSTVNAETSAPYAGTYACRFDQDSVNSNAQVTQAVLTVGKKYKVTFYAKATNATGQDLLVSDSNSNQIVVALTNSYALYTTYFTATATGFAIRRGTSAGNASKSIFVDNITLICTEVGSANGIAAGLSIDSNLCASFTTAGQKLAKASNATLQPAASSCEFGGWVNSSDLKTEGGIIGKMNTSGQFEYKLIYTSTAQTFLTYLSANGTSITALQADGTINPNQWYFVTGFYDAANSLAGVTINGVVKTAAFTGPIYSGTDDFDIGYNASQGTFKNARIDGAFFIKRLLTAGERTAMINAGKGVKYAGLPSTIHNATTFYDQVQLTRSGAYNYGKLTGNQKHAESFTAGQTNMTGLIWMRDADVGTFTGTVTVSIQSDNSNKPSGTVLASHTYTNAQYEALGITVNITESLNVALTVGTKYWAVFETSTLDNSNYVQISGNGTKVYSGGDRAIWDGSAWGLGTTSNLTFATIVSADPLTGFWNLDEYSSGAGAITRLDSTANANNLTDNGTTPSGQGVNYLAGTVSKIVDSSGNSYNFTQTTQANKPLYVTNVINGQPMVFYNGVNMSVLNATDIIGTGDFTFACVFKPTGFLAAGTSGRIIDNGKFILGISNDYSNVLYAGSAGSLSVRTADGALTANSYYALVSTRKASGALSFYLNGSLSGSPDQASGTPAAATTSTYIGNRPAGDRPYLGYLGDIGILLPYIASPTQIAQITKDLRNKYGF